MSPKKLIRIAACIIMEDACKELLGKDFKREVWDKSFDHKTYLKAADDEELFQTMCEMFFYGMFDEQITKIAATFVKDILD